MDIFSHVLWANLVIPGDPRLIIAASVLPDAFDGINWIYCLSKGRGIFWKTKEDFIGLVTGTEKYCQGYLHVNRGLFYKVSLFINSVWFVGFLGIIAPKEFFLAYGLHILIDAFTHKNSEVWQPFYPLTDWKLRVGVTRWSLEPSLLLGLNFAVLALFYLLRFSFLQG